MGGHGEVAALVEEGRGVLAAARSAGGWAGHPAVTLQCRPMHAFMPMIVQCRLYQHSRTACGTISCKLTERWLTHWRRSSGTGPTL